MKQLFDDQVSVGLSQFVERHFVTQGVMNFVNVAVRRPFVAGYTAGKYGVQCQGRRGNGHNHYSVSHNPFRTL